MEFMRLYIALIFTAFVCFADAFAASCGAGDSREESAAAPIAGLIFKATLPSKAGEPAKEITFVPTTHHQPFTAFTKEFQDAVCGAKALVLERVDGAGVRAVGDVESYGSADGTFDFSKFKTNFRHDAAHVYEVSYTDDEHKPLKGYLVDPAGSADIFLLATKKSGKDEGMLNLLRVLRYVSAEKLKTLEGGLSDVPTWDLPAHDSRKAPLESLFGGLYTEMEKFGLHRHVEHFRNIYTMSSALVGGLYYLLGASNAEDQSKGMDNVITEIYEDAKKPIAGVETLIDVLSFTNFKVTFDDIKDDFASPDSELGAYRPTLQDMHVKTHRGFARKTSATEAFTAKRNQAWMPQYEGLLATHGDILCAHGSNHFPGREGLWTLGQALGWTWSVRNWTTGAYDPFVYTWNAEHPFAALAGTPLGI